MILLVCNLLFTVQNVSVNISVNATTGEVCFYSTPQGCDLIQLTQYMVLITDLTKNVIFTNETVPESSCVNVPHCYPLLLSVQPLNSFITYNNPVDQQIRGIYD